MLICAVATPAYSIVLRCFFEVERHIVVGDRYTSRVSAGTSEREIDEVTDIIADHLPGRSNKDVQAFTTANIDWFQHGGRFPRNLYAFFPDLYYCEMMEGYQTRFTMSKSFELTQINKSKQKLGNPPL